MGPFWLVACLIFVGLAILEIVLVCVQVHEHRRFAHSRLRSLRRRRARGRVAVIVPCKGVDEDLEANLHALFRQDYGNYEIIFAVEASDDPAYELIQRVGAAHPGVDWGIILAGLADGTGQKVHNLLAATARLSPDVEYLAFADSDAQPSPYWLRAIVSHLDQKRVGAATGYRWFVPESPTPASLLLYSINSHYASLYGKHTPNFVWGGSWAIRRDMFERLGIRDAWQGTLSDDFVVSRVVRGAGFRIEFEPAAMVASPLERQALAPMLSFVRRQYVIAKSYTPRGWLLIFGLAQVAGLGLLATLGFAAWGLAHGNSWTWPPACLLAAMYLTYIFRGLVRQDVAKTYFPHLTGRLGAACRFDIWGAPLADLVNALSLVSSVVGRHITWRGVTYRILRGGRIQVVRRQDAPAPAPPQTEPGSTPPPPHITPAPVPAYKKAG